MEKKNASFQKFYEKWGEIDETVRKLPKILKIIKDGHGYNYGVRAELTKEAINNHVLWLKKTVIEVKDRFNKLLAELEI